MPLFGGQVGSVEGSYIESGYSYVINTYNKSRFCKGVLVLVWQLY